MRDLSGREENTDRINATDKANLNPPEDRTIAIERKIASENISQILVNETIQKEQDRYSVKHTVQDYPGIPEGKRLMDNVEIAMATEPERMFDPVKTPPLERTTIMAKMREKLGVPNIEARTKFGAVPIPLSRKDAEKSLPAQGLPVTERNVSNTPVKNLNMLDKFFNWVNAFLR